MRGVGAGNDATGMRGKNTYIWELIRKRYSDVLYVPQGDRNGQRI
ncbi:MAG: hypothetical protein RLZZ437_3301 [Pseudomonadota bacterium]|jgi:hypothetical protein